MHPIDPAIAHAGEPLSNDLRKGLGRAEPRSLRTFTPTQAVLQSSAGVFHWTPEGRRLYDFTSGVLVANLGHNPTAWMRNFSARMGWPVSLPETPPDGYRSESRRRILVEGSRSCVQRSTGSS